MLFMVEIEDYVQHLQHEPFADSSPSSHPWEYTGHILAVIFIVETLMNSAFQCHSSPSPSILFVVNLNFFSFEWFCFYLVHSSQLKCKEISKWTKKTTATKTLETSQTISCTRLEKASVPVVWGTEGELGACWRGVTQLCPVHRAKPSKPLLRVGL